MTRNLPDKIIDYEAVSRPTVSALNERVTEPCKRGYLPIGGVSASIAVGIVNGDSFHQCVYSQALVLHVTEEV